MPARIGDASAYLENGYCLISRSIASLAGAVAAGQIVVKMIFAPSK
jgi:hypothetical protein